MIDKMRLPIFILAAATCAPSLLAQVTPEQRVQDFQVLVNLYSRRYAPAEWKNQALRFDLSNTNRWLERVRSAKDDIEYHEIALEYVAMLEDTHSSYTAPGNASASLGFSVDIYDGKVLIESIDRSRLPVAEYPFMMGDELVSVDGRTAEEWIEHLARFRKFGNPATTRRMAADRITFRSQSTYPRIGELGDTALVVVRRASGELGTYTLAWKKTNIPYSGSPSLPKSLTRQSRSEGGYMDVLQSMWNWSAPMNDTVFQGEAVDEDGNSVPRRYVLGYGGKQPTFALPSGFVMRLGKTPADFHVSGTYEADGLRIGYLRFPNFSPQNPGSAIQELDKEIQYFNENTDGLVVDVSRNTGGGCYMLDVARRLMRDDFWFFGEEIRPTWDRIQILQAGLEAARQQKADDWVITMLSHNVDQLLASYRAGSHRTEALPSCYFQGMAPAWMNTPVQNPYTKPLIVLVDEFSTSAGDIFAAMMQDNHRGPLVGMRTNGAGGAVSHPWLAGPFTEAMVSNTNTLVVRRDYVANAPDLPVNRYIENTGVRPEIVIDRMTRENLMNGGKPFVEAFTKALTDHIRSTAN